MFLLGGGLYSGGLMVMLAATSVTTGQPLSSLAYFTGPFSIDELRRRLETKRHSEHLQDGVKRSAHEVFAFPLGSFCRCDLYRETR